MAKILIADDESRIRRLVCDFLKRAGHEALEAGTGNDVIRIINSDTSVDLYLLDVMIPEVNGFELCKKIKKISPETPVILLTARSAESDEITGFDAGADDYITKPFSPIVLIKRINAILKRYKSDDVSDNKFVFKGLVMNNTSHEVMIDGNKIDLTVKEYKILSLLLNARGKVFSRNELLEEVWGSNYDGDVRNVDSHVARLRNKLGDWGDDNLKTIYGLGYKIEVN